MRYSQRWGMIVVLLFAFAWTVSAPTAQTEEPSSVSAPSSAEVQSDSIEAQPSSDESEQKKPTLTPNRDMASAAYVEMDRRFNELRREILDDRAKVIDWWLEATAIFLTLLGVAAAILGYFGFKRLDRIESEARENMEASAEHAQEAQSNLEEIKARRDEAYSLLVGMTAEVADDDPSKASEVVKNVQQNPGSSLIDRAVSEAILLQQQNRTDEAIEQRRSIANITEGTDDERATQSWFSIGYLFNSKDEPDFNEAINAYDEALRLNPSSVGAYNNRGFSKAKIGRFDEAIADYDEALRLDPDSVKAYYNRGNSKAEVGRFDEAIADYDEALRLNPDDANAYNNRGLVKLQLRRIDEARQDFETALNLAQAMGNAEVMEQARLGLENLDRDDAP